MINARAETVKSKPADRNALRQRRTRIPAAGLDEWKSGKGGTTRPGSDQGVRTGV
jgi:putative SOS response-associated peptidase YedK